MIFDPSTGVSTSYPIREIFQKFWDDYALHHNVSRQQCRTADCIRKCKTGLLGHTVSYCETCGYEKIHYASCNNRDCPSCQQPLEKKWVMERESELIEGIAYYHVIFTVPYELNDLIYENQKLLYDLLFSCASETLITLCRDKKYMDALKKYHAAGKLHLTGKCQHLRNSYSWSGFIDTLYGKKWCPFVKETFNGNGNAMQYLARYTYRTAISNSRIESITENEVSFRYTDYADGNKKKTKTVSGEEFIHLFLQHVLPTGFHRVRFSGYLANCQKAKNPKRIHRLRGSVYGGNPVKGKSMAELMMLLYQADICHCPICKHQLIQIRQKRPLLHKAG